MEPEFSILIVEDMLSWQRKFVRYLQNEPVRIELAANFQTAVDLIVKHHFDLAILDVNLTNVSKNIDGIHLGELIRQQDANVKIIVVSGSHSASESLRLRAFEPDGCFSKATFEHEDFIRCVRQNLANSVPNS